MRSESSTEWDGVAAPGKGHDGRLIHEVRREHCDSLDSRWRFSSDEYGVQTTSETEYWFVVAPEKGLAHLGLTTWPVEARTPDEAVVALTRAKRPHPTDASVDFKRRPKALRDFDAPVRDINARLVGMHVQPLRREELVCARLLTGPMRCKYNAALRALAASCFA